MTAKTHGPGSILTPRWTVSVVICTLGRFDHLDRLLEALERQTRVPEEIVIVDGGTDPEPSKALLNNARVTYSHQPDGGQTHARNRGVEIASGDICVFLDDDVIPEEEFFDRLLETYNDHPNAGGVGGIPIEEGKPGPLRRLLLRAFLRGPFSDPVRRYISQPGHEPIRVDRLTGCVSSYRAEVFEQFSFDENLLKSARGEDLDFSYRVAQAHPLMLVPGLRVKHAGEGWAARNPREKTEAKVLAHAYHFLKNVRGSPGGTAAFGWLMFGLLGEALIHSVVQMSAQPLAGYLSGLKATLSGMDGAGGFIDRDPRRVSPS